MRFPCSGFEALHLWSVHNHSPHCSLCSKVVTLIEPHGYVGGFFRALLAVYESGAGAKNSWEKTIGLRRANCPEPPCADDDAAELAQLGWLYEKQGRLKRAVKQFVAATAIDPALAKRTHHALASLATLVDSVDVARPFLIAPPEAPPSHLRRAQDASALNGPMVPGQHHWEKSGTSQPRVPRWPVAVASGGGDSISGDADLAARGRQHPAGGGRCVWRVARAPPRVYYGCLSAVDTAIGRLRSALGRRPSTD